MHAVTADPGGEAAQGTGEGGFEVHLDVFEGPFDLLLGLISKHKLDITEVALSQVTDEFIAYIRALADGWDLDQASYFLLVAATLLDLKAARLLPSGEVEDEEDLALLEARDLLFARLLQYRAYKEVAAVFAGRMSVQGRRFARRVPMEPQFAELLPEVLLGLGPVEFAAIAARALAPRPVPEVSTEHLHSPTTTVREQADILAAQLSRLGRATFRRLSADCSGTYEVVARFLALLELYREGSVSFDQVAPLGELYVTWVTEPGLDDETGPVPQAGAAANPEEENGVHSMNDRVGPAGDAGDTDGPGDPPGRSAAGAESGLAGGEPGPGDADADLVDGPGGPGLRASLEAILLVVDEPVPEVVIAQVLERPRGEITAALRDLAASYDAEQRGFDLREVAGGWRFYTRADCAPVVERFVRDGQEVRLTQAALETLAVVAYRQPVNRARVSAVRGVNCDSVLRTLTLRGLVEEAGTEAETGAILYRTTGYFLERLGLANLEELPDLAPFLPEHVEDVEDAVDEHQAT